MNQSSMFDWNFDIYLYRKKCTCSNVLMFSPFLSVATYCLMWLICGIGWYLRRPWWVHIAAPIVQSTGYALPGSYIYTPYKLWPFGVRPFFAGLRRKGTSLMVISLRLDNCHLLMIPRNLPVDWKAADVMELLRVRTYSLYIHMVKTFVNR